jgi:hypothetical protein
MNKLFADLENEIKQAYEGDGTTAEEAEKLAAKFLHAQMQISAELKRAQLDARMRKSGVKTIRAALYLEIVSKGDKKPTESHIAATLDADTIVQSEQREYDVAEVSVAELERYYDICTNGHIFMRSIAKGNFLG